MNRGITRENLIKSLITNTKVKVIMIVTIIISLVIGVVYFNSSLYLLKQIESLAKKNEISSYDNAKLKDYTTQVLNKNKKNNFNRILDIMEDNNSINKSTILNQINESHKEQINFERFMNLLIQCTNDDEATICEILKFNSQDDNEDIFMNNFNNIVNQDNETLIRLLSLYFKYDIGSCDEIYKMDISNDDIMNAYLNEKLEKDNFYGFAANRDNDQLFNCFIKKEKENIKSLKNTDASILYNKFKNLELSISEESQSKLDMLNTIFDLINNKTSFENEKSDLNKKKSDNDNELSEKNNQISSLNTSNSQKESKIRDYESSMALNQNQITNISGYIVSQVSSSDTEHVYEAAFLNDSNNRFVLKTHKTVFNSRGTFSLQVLVKGTEEVKLKDEYGGFDQSWSSYEEFEGSPIYNTFQQTKGNITNLQNEINSNNQKITTIQQEIDEINKFNNTYNNNLNEIDNKISSIDQEINEMVESL